VGERKAATLAVTLMLPLGLCILPAFMVLGVAPLLIAVISSTVTGL
jgi:tight adherence protein B